MAVSDPRSQLLSAEHDSGVAREKARNLRGSHEVVVAGWQSTQRQRSCMDASTMCPASTQVPAWIERSAGVRRSARPAHFSIDGFQTFQTLPTSAGPGFSVICPGSQPAGVASVPLLARTCWNA